MISRNVRPHISTITTMMKGCAEAGKVDKVAEYAAEVEKRNIKPSAQYFNFLLNFHLKRGEVETAMTILKKMKKREMDPDDVTFGILMQYYISVGQRERALDLLVVAEKTFGIRPTVVLYNILLKAAVTADGAELSLAEGLYRDMRRRKVKPNVGTFTMLLQACSKSVPPDLEAAARWIGVAAKRGVELDRVAYNQLLMGYAVAGDFESIRFIMEHMRKVGVQPAGDTYNVLLHGVVRHGFTYRCEEILEEMKEGGVRCDVFTMNSLIRGWIEKGHLVTAVKWYRYFVTDQGVRPDAVTFRLLIGAHVRNGEVGMAKKLFASMKVRGVDAGARVWHEVLLGIASCGDARGIRPWLEEMRGAGVAWTGETMTRGAEGWVQRFRTEYGIQPTAEVFEWLIKGAADCRDLGAAEEWYRTMMQGGCVPSLKTYGFILDGYCKNGESGKAERWFEEVWEGGLTPDEGMYGMLINMYVKRGDFANAERWWSRMVEDVGDGIRDPGVFNTFVHGHVVHPLGKGRVEALRWWDEMVRRGIRPTSQSYSCLMSVYAREGTTDEVVRLFEQLVEGGDAVHGAGMTQATAAVVLDGLGWQKAGELTTRIWKRIFAGECGFKPDENIWASYMEALIRNGKIGLAWEVVKDMQKAGIRPGGKTMGTWVTMTGRLRDKRWVQLGRDEISSLGIEEEVKVMREKWVEAKRQQSGRWVGRTGPLKDEYPLGVSVRSSST
ncbi:hypothetical protein HDV00_010921 [Rhizophlyctis rosea]|nr:hypothetical protein HDV00_010921 [Rhizophlyctis rosea]